jgi:hypothetical protein
MWEAKVFLLDYFWGELSPTSVLGSPGSSAFIGGGVDSKVDSSLLIGVSEGVEDLFWVVEMSSVSVPPWVWDLVVEKS